MTKQKEKNTIDIVSEIASSKRARVLHKIIDSLPKHLYEQIEDGHCRYMHLIDVTSGEFTQEEVSEDREKFPHMIKKSPNGNNYFVDDDCAELIFKIHGIPRILSHMYIFDDLNWTAASGFIEEDDFIEVNNNFLSKYFDNKEEVDQLINFIQERNYLIDIQPLLKLRKQHED